MLFRSVSQSRYGGENGAGKSSIVEWLHYILNPSIGLMAPKGYAYVIVFARTVNACTIAPVNSLKIFPKAISIRWDLNSNSRSNSILHACSSRAVKYQHPFSILNGPSTNSIPIVLLVVRVFRVVNVLCIPALEPP